VVAPNWLVDQLALRADAVCGCVDVEDWSGHSHAVRVKYEAHYNHMDGHRHIHGANLGVSAHAYESVGGFADLKVSEDVALVNALVDSGANVVWSAAPKVTTSARRRARASGGFADFLIALADRGDCLFESTDLGQSIPRIHRPLSTTKRLLGFDALPDAASAALE
jgi:hypothetical protein